MAPRFAILNNGTQARETSIVLVNQVIVLRGYENCAIIGTLKLHLLSFKEVIYKLIQIHANAMSLRSQFLTLRYENRKAWFVYSSITVY
jgi:hypothetical protein